MAPSSFFPLQTIPTGRRFRVTQHGSSDRAHSTRWEGAISSPQSSQPCAVGSPPTCPPAAAPTCQQVRCPASSLHSSPAASPQRTHSRRVTRGHWHLQVGAPTHPPPPPSASRCRHAPEAAPAHATPGGPPRQRPPASASNHSHPIADIPARRARACNTAGPRQRVDALASQPSLLPASWRPCTLAAGPKHQQQPKHAKRRGYGLEKAFVG